jgi:hypothetical protein
MFEIEALLRDIVDPEYWWLALIITLAPVVVLGMIVWPLIGHLRDNGASWRIRNWELGAAAALVVGAVAISYLSYDVSEAPSLLWILVHLALGVGLGWMINRSIWPDLEPPAGTLSTVRTLGTMFATCAVWVAGASIIMRALGRWWLA